MVSYAAIFKHLKKLNSAIKLWNNEGQKIINFPKLSSSFSSGFLSFPHFKGLFFIKEEKGISSSPLSCLSADNFLSRGEKKALMHVTQTCDNKNNMHAQINLITSLCTPITSK